MIGSILDQRTPSETDEDLERRLRRLERKWNDDTEFLSNSRVIVEHPSFREIIELGERAVPILLRDLDAKPSLWVWALQEMTGENPVRDADRGDIRRMTEAWLQWGREKGLG